MGINDIHSEIADPESFEELGEDETLTLKELKKALREGTRLPDFLNDDDQILQYTAERAGTSRDHDDGLLHGMQILDHLKSQGVDIKNTGASLAERIVDTSSWEYFNPQQQSLPDTLNYLSVLFRNNYIDEIGLSHAYEAFLRNEKNHTPEQIQEIENYMIEKFGLGRPYQANAEEEIALEELPSNTSTKKYRDDLYKRLNRFNEETGQNWEICDNLGMNGMICHEADAAIAHSMSKALREIHPITNIVAPVTKGSKTSIVRIDPESFLAATDEKLDRAATKLKNIEIPDPNDTSVAEEQSELQQAFHENRDAITPEKERMAKIDAGLAKNDELQPFSPANTSSFKI